MVDLRPDQLATVNAILLAEVPDYEIWAFGSRAQWTAKDSSDLDLAIVTERPLSPSRLSHLRQAFEQSYLPFTVDVVDLSRVSPEFRKVIKKQRAVFHKPDENGGGRHAFSERRALPLEDAVETIIDYRGKTPRKVNAGIPLITAKIIKNGKIDTPNEFISTSDYDGWMRRGFPQAGDVLLTTEAPLGEVAQLENAKVALAQRVVALRGKKELLDNDFLKYLLQSREVQDQLKSRASGTTVQGIKQSELRKISLTLPPIYEQRVIARVLGTLDDKIELNLRMNETLEAMAQALFKSWFIDFAPFCSKGDISTSNFPDDVRATEIGEIPNRWTVKSVYDCAKFINGIAFSKVHFSTEGSGLPIVKIAELKDGITAQTKFTKDQLPEKHKIRDEDILFSWSGSPDTSIDAFVWSGGEAWLNQHIFKVQLNSMFEKLFVYYLLKYLRPTFIEIARDKQTTGLGHVTAEDLKRLKVAYPSVAVMEAFQRLVEPLFRRSFCTMTESRTLAVLRDALLPKLLSGEIALN
jgi:type I restriction enzyme S subunit